MAILNRDEFFESLNTFIGDRNDNDSIQFMENMSDTYEDLSTKANGDGEDWKQKYIENDKMWKERYKNRFFSGNTGNSENLGYPEENEEEKKPISIDDLFEKKD